MGKQSNESKMHQWVNETINRLGKSYFSEILYCNLYWMWKELQSDNDICLVIDGFTGEGKSTLAHQICSSIDESYPGENHLRICDNPRKLLRALEISKKLMAINVDEASISGLSGKTSGTKEGISIQQILEICRAKNLFLVLCLPSFWQLNKYIREDRCDALIHVPERGDLYVFNKQQTKNLSIKACKYHNYSAVKPTFYGHFIKDIPSQVNYELYLKNKMQNINDVIRKARSRLEQGDADADPAYTPLAVAARVIGVSAESLKERVRRDEVQGRKIGHKWYINTTELKRLLPKNHLVPEKTGVYDLQKDDL